MSYYGFDPHDWRDKLPPGVKFYDFGGGTYQVPMTDPSGGSYLAASAIALVADPAAGTTLDVMMFSIAHAAYIRKNSDWGPYVDKMVEHWKNDTHLPTELGGKMQTIAL